MQELDNCSDINIQLSLIYWFEATDFPGFYI